ncbi:uncharacterized protein LOC62_01G000880 [Vanrija pseudolonga]|uniref:Uncharacterized protein n=1 Tax=Vanrija pseudolonga TaxID=143232 RepID=A0AAF1BFD4_9TREE|nr:hypothetical protein LOC62_01G000880 [Vanrija pseudolonga]
MAPVSEKEHLDLAERNHARDHALAAAEHHKRAATRRAQAAIDPTCDGPYVAWALTATSILCLLATTLSAPFTKLSLLSTPVPIGLWGHCDAYTSSASCELTWPWPTVRGGEVLAYTGAFGPLVSWTNLSVPICVLVQLGALAALHTDSSRGRWTLYPAISVIASSVAMFTFVSVYTGYVRAAAVLSLNVNIRGAVTGGPGLTAVLIGCGFALIANPLSSLETHALDWLIDRVAGADWHPEEGMVRLEEEEEEV